MQTLSELLSQRHSKAQCNEIINWVGIDAERFMELYKICLGKDEELARMAVWPLSYVAPVFQLEFLSKIDKVLQKCNDKNQHPAIKRNFLRCFKQIKIPETKLGEWFELLNETVMDTNEAGAIRAFAMEAIRKNYTAYPELIELTKLYVAERMEMESPAFVSVGKKLLKNRV